MNVQSGLPSGIHETKRSGYLSGGFSGKVAVPLKYRKYIGLLGDILFIAFSLVLVLFLVLLILDVATGYRISSHIDMGIFAAVLLLTGLLSVVTGGIPPEKEV